MRKFFLLALFLSVSFLQSSFLFSEEPSETTQKKKSHNWLIPVGAGAGAGLGLLIGFNAFDEAINSDAKIWTTTAVCAAAGGLLGWLFARHMDRPKPANVSLQPDPVIVPAQNFVCTREGSGLRQQADCMYPDHLSMQ